MAVSSDGTLPFLMKVMSRFESKREKYCEFLQIFTDFNNKDYVDWNLQRLKELFNGDRSMVAEYCRLLTDEMKKTKKRDGFGEAFRSVYRTMMRDNHNSHADNSDSDQNILRGHAEMDRMVHIGEMNEKNSGDKCRKLDMRSVTEREGYLAVVPDHKIIMTESLQTEGREKDKARSLKRKRDKRNDKKALSIPSDTRSEKRSQKEIDATRKPISQLDLSCCQSCTPSYRLLPKKLIDPCESQRTELDASVLNDSWVSVYNGKGCSGKKTNKYQELLFKLEDDMCELDLLIESVTATTDKLDNVIMKMQDSNLAFKFEMEKDLSSANLRCIRQFFEQSGRNIRNVGRENDLLELQVMLKDLKQWESELKMRREDFHLLCRDTFSELTPKL